jgi:glycosyltransferase involved in cell wall biosynthesis
MITLIIPCKNEAGTISTCIKESINLSGVTEVLVVHGNSQDRTKDIILTALERYGKQDDSKKIRLINQNDNGKWNAVRLGINQAENSIISIWDADLSVSPYEQELIHQAFLGSIARYPEQTIFVSGNRMREREKGSMRFSNVIGNYLFGILFSASMRYKIEDTLCGSKIFDRDILKKISNKTYMSDPFGDFSIIFGSYLNKSKLNFIPVTYRARVYGQTNIMRWRDGIKLLRCFIYFLRFDYFKGNLS